MSVIILLIGCSVFVALSFLFAFIWAAKTGQWKDDYTPSIRILFPDTIPDTNKDDKKLKSKKKK